MAEAERGRATHSPDWLTSGSSHLWLPYAQMKVAPQPIAVAGADGARLKLADGRELIDGVSSWWTVCHGYNHPHIRESVAAQLQSVPHVMLGGLATEPTLRLAKRLADLLPGDLDHVFFSESGSVSVEIAMKMAVQYWINKGWKGRHRFVSFRFGYHGDTLAAMSVCDPDEGMHGLFKGYLPQQIIADVPRTKEQQAEFVRLLRAHRDEAAAIIIEPLVQGAGGMKFFEPEVLRFLRRACDEADCLLILDEIMTGFGRVGPMFACAEAEIVPDIITVSKALTGGTLPLAATIARAHVFEAFLSDDPSKALMHGPTYMGNALGCAAANASLDLFEREPRLQQVRAIAAQLRSELEPCRRLNGVVDVRVRGALGVVQLNRAGEGPWFRPRFLEDGVWIRPFGDIVYVAPPFVISSDELSRLTQAIVRHVSAWSQQRAAA
jgi:adenosylmethionine-8-amino-7-oxononanoate aminotransferase